MSEIKDKIFQDPEIKYPALSGLSFSDYIHISRSIIAKNRVDLNQNNQHIIIDNSPFEYRPDEPNQEGVLLVHGLFDSAFIMQDIGKKLVEAGYLVRAILLPGHGTVPGALLNVTYEQWLATVQYGLQTFKNEVEKVHIVGFSLGGALALLQPNLASYTLLAPAFKIRSMFAGLSKYFRPFAPRFAWFYRDPEETIDYVKYRSVPYNAVYQVHLVTKIIENISLSAPSFFALPLNDMTVCSKATIQYFKKNQGFKNKMILYSPTNHEERDSRIIIKTSRYPDLHIADFSHPGMPISPTNQHYGEKGDYPNASHQPISGKTIYGEFSGLQLKWNNIALQYAISSCKLERLSYNPDFADLSDQILEFMMNC